MASYGKIDVSEYHSESLTRRYFEAHIKDNMKHTIILLVFCTLFISNIAYSVTEEPVWNKRNVKIAIAYYADKYNVSASTMDKVVGCESGYNPNAVGDGGKSFGLSQIYNPAHPNITKEQALDPKFALEFMASNLAKGRGNMWTCYRMVKNYKA